MAMVCEVGFVGFVGWEIWEAWEAWDLPDFGRNPIGKPLGTVRALEGRNNMGFGGLRLVWGHGGPFF
jgi:hypothetical protein